MEGITDLHSIPPNKLKSLLRDAIDASLSQADAPQCDDPEYSPTLSSSHPPSPLKKEQTDSEKSNDIITSKDNDEKDEKDTDGKEVEIEVSDGDDDEEKVVGADDEEIALDFDDCGSEPPVDSPDDVKYKKILLSIVRYCNLKLPPARAPLVYFNITMSSVKRY